MTDEELREKATLLAKLWSESNRRWQVWRTGSREKADTHTMGALYSACIEADNEWRTGMYELATKLDSGGLLP